MEPGYIERAHQQQVPRRRPRRFRSRRTLAMELRTASARRRNHVVAAEDDHRQSAGDEPAASPDQPDHALDDADNVRLLHIPVPGWPGTLHLVLKHRRHSYSVLRRRKTTYCPVGASIPGQRGRAGEGTCRQALCPRRPSAGRRRFDRGEG
jgi:hypothetical protein